MLSRLGKMGVTIQIILRTNIILIAAEILGIFVHQCVLSFHSYLQYGVMLLLSRLSDQSINAVVGSCKQQHCHRCYLVVLPSLLCAAIIIVVKKRLVNSFFFCRQWKCNHGCVAAEVVAATAQ
jgi:hypothetical protein